MARTKIFDTAQQPKTLLVAVHAPYNKASSTQAYYDEFLHLISSNRIVYDDVMYIKLRSLDSGYFLTKGKLEELHALCEKEQYEQVIFSEILTPMQERNLSELLQTKVYDRTQLILEIFEKNAHSAEGKLQVEIALFQHKKSRVAGKGAQMSQQAGHIGQRGPGETAKEVELQHYEAQINKFKRQLANLVKIRETQRKQRIENKVPMVCLVGYTNSGKSTILNQLTKADVLVEDRLFATLDTTTRELYVDGKKKGVISDTVGFIQQLPPKLVDAFKSTLDELQYADLLLHVIDLSDKNWESHIAVVQEILQDLHIEKEMLYVFNKVDKINNIEELRPALRRYQPHVLISASNKENIQTLLDFLSKWSK